jgi:hypothetical protein
LDARNVTLPRYNEFSMDPVCIGAEEFSLCQRWGEISVSHEDFVIRVEEFKNRKQDRLIRQELRQEVPTWWDRVLSFVGNYYMLLVLAVVLLVLALAGMQKSIS